MSEAERGPGLTRLLFTLAALAAGMVGFALAAALARARTTDAFIVPPEPSDLAAYLIATVALASLALALEFGSAPIAARGGRAARALRAALRRRVRRQRSVVDIERVEAGLTVSACMLLSGLALWVASAKALLAAAAVIALWLSIRTLWSVGPLLDYAPRASALIGFVAGLLAGGLIT
jgi:hypothetical protein